MPTRLEVSANSNPIRTPPLLPKWLLQPLNPSPRLPPAQARCVPRPLPLALARPRSPRPASHAVWTQRRESATRSAARKCFRPRTASSELDSMALSHAPPRSTPHSPTTHLPLHLQIAPRPPPSSLVALQSARSRRAPSCLPRSATLHAVPPARRSCRRRPAEAPSASPSEPSPQRCSTSRRASPRACGLDSSLRLQVSTRVLQTPDFARMRTIAPAPCALFPWLPDAASSEPCCEARGLKLSKFRVPPDPRAQGH